ncbi:hypothetical protein EsH8_VIII_000499 [Colletotrichum jinshuiense]
MSQFSQQSEAPESPVTMPTIDDVPQLADRCKLISATFLDYMSKENKTAQDHEAGGRCVDEVELIQPQVEGILKAINIGCWAQGPGSPDISAAQWFGTMERLATNQDPQNVEARYAETHAFGFDETPELAERFKTVAARYKELEQNPYKPGDDAQAFIEREIEIILEVGKVKMLLGCVFDGILWALTGKERQSRRETFIEVELMTESDDEDEDRNPPHLNREDATLEDNTESTAGEGAVESKSTLGAKE